MIDYDFIEFDRVQKIRQIILEKYFSKDYKIACSVWSPIYEEYRRINYRLPKYEQLSLF